MIGVNWRKMKFLSSGDVDYIKKCYVVHRVAIAYFGGSIKREGDIFPVFTVKLCFLVLHLFHLSLFYYIV